MGTPRYGHTAVRLLDGRVLVVGGANHDEENDTSAEVYDPDSGTWSATGNMVRPRGGFAFAATLLRDGKVLVGDGQGAEVYDPEVGTWTVTGPMAVMDPDGTSHWGSATLLRDGRALVVHDERQLRGLRTRQRNLGRHGTADTTRGHPDADHARRWQGARGRRRGHVSRREPGRSIRSGHWHLDRHWHDGIASP